MSDLSNFGICGAAGLLREITLAEVPCKKRALTQWDDRSLQVGGVVYLFNG
jgi:hypothetical protein